mmetsp:Transcript_68183/g.133785  ORF Transcript_68183/g.133785 Transcript_68183/m.133785 type:complete len:276 (-) Transcript_68183:932-1759(-)
MTRGGGKGRLAKGGKGLVRVETCLANSANTNFPSSAAPSAASPLRASTKPDLTPSEAALASASSSSSMSSVGATDPGSPGWKGGCSTSERRKRNTRLPSLGWDAISFTAFSNCLPRSALPFTERSRSRALILPDRSAAPSPGANPVTNSQCDAPPARVEEWFVEGVADSDVSPPVPSPETSSSLLALLPPPRLLRGKDEFKLAGRAAPLILSNKGRSNSASNVTSKSANGGWNAPRTRFPNTAFLPPLFFPFDDDDDDDDASVLSPLRRLPCGWV